MTDPAVPGQSRGGLAPQLQAKSQALLDEGSIGAIETAGALSVVEGRSGGRALRVVLTDRSIAGGSFGTEESELLAATFVRSREDRTPLVLALDSGGARLSSGLAGLGAFRRMYRAGIDLRLSGVPMVAYLERDCFGGASMLAMLCGARGASDKTRIGMSGPAIIEAFAGKQDLDATDRDAVRALFGAPARDRVGAIDLLIDVQLSQHDTLGSLLQLAAEKQVDIEACRGKLQQRLQDAGVATPSLSLPDALQLFRRGTAVGAREIWQLADAVLSVGRGESILLRVDCPGQAASRHEEQLVLSEYVVHLALCLRHCCTSGNEIVTRIEGEASGGIYVALAAGVTRVEATPEAKARVLPARAVEVVLGHAPEDESVDDALAAGIVDRLVPGDK